jgi:type II secretory pathway component PulL
LAEKWYQKGVVQAAIISGALLIVAALVNQFGPKARLEKEVDQLKKENQRLETQIAPFRAIAVERFGGSADEALAKLSAQVHDIEAQLERAEGTIRRSGGSTLRWLQRSLAIGRLQNRQISRRS